MNLAPADGRGPHQVAQRSLVTLNAAVCSATAFRETQQNGINTQSSKQTHAKADTEGTRLAVSLFRPQRRDNTVATPRPPNRLARAAGLRASAPIAVPPRCAWGWPLQANRSKLFQGDSADRPVEANFPSRPSRGRLRGSCLGSNSKDLKGTVTVRGRAGRLDEGSSLCGTICGKPDAGPHSDALPERNALHRRGQHPRRSKSPRS